MTIIRSVSGQPGVSAPAREVLGERVSDWVRSQTGVVIMDRADRQASDREFHCLTIVLFFAQVERRS